MIKPKKIKTKKCKHITCGKSFVPYKYNPLHIFCSPKCQIAYEAKKKREKNKKWMDKFLERQIIIKLGDTEIQTVPLEYKPGLKGNNFPSSTNFDKIQRGKYMTSKGEIFFRSKWEANYALFLDFQKKNGIIKDWEYEPETFVFEAIKFGTRSYTPDFKVINPIDSFEYHEVKGYMDNRSLTKLKRMAKYYPQIKIDVITNKEYSDILRKFKGVIKFY